MQNEHFLIRKKNMLSPACLLSKILERSERFATVLFVSPWISFFGFPVHLQCCGHVSTEVIAFTPNTLAYYIDDSWNAD
jgi:hypothetical protein